MRPNRIRLGRTLALAAAFLGAPMLSGCGSDQTTGPVENIPKESPVLTTGKDSMQEFIKNRKAQSRPAAKK